MADGPARAATSFTVTIGDLQIAWKPASESDRIPVEIRDASRESVLTYTDLTGVAELRDALDRFIEHHRTLLPDARGEQLPAPPLL